MLGCGLQDVGQRFQDLRSNVAGFRDTKGMRRVSGIQADVVDLHWRCPVKLLFIVKLTGMQHIQPTQHLSWITVYLLCCASLRLHRASR